MTSEKLSNGDFLKLFTESPDEVPSHLLLPHEQTIVERAFRDKVAEFDKIVRDKEHVTGGDDWHDGAFRATDNEALVLSGRLATVSPFLGATVVEYPAIDEERASLGSRAYVAQNGLTFPVDIIGFRQGYPEDVIDEETNDAVAGVSPDSPLGQSIIGRTVGEETHYKNGERTIKAKIVRIDQLAIPKYFLNQSGVNADILVQDQQT